MTHIVRKLNECLPACCRCNQLFQFSPHKIKPLIRHKNIAYSARWSAHAFHCCRDRYSSSSALSDMEIYSFSLWSLLWFVFYDWITRQKHSFPVVSGVGFLMKIFPLAFFVSLSRAILSTLISATCIGFNKPNEEFAPYRDASEREREKIAWTDAIWGLFNFPSWVEFQPLDDDDKFLSLSLNLQWTGMLCILLYERFKMAKYELGYIKR